MGDAKHYYFARGRREPLELDEDTVALDLEQAESAKGKTAAAARLLADKGQELRRGVYLIARKSIPAGEQKGLDAANALQPVFRHGSTTLVALPEVRIERPGKGETADRVRQALQSVALQTDVVEDRGYRLTLRPKSGSGMDALNLANQIAEQVDPGLAHVRFLRIIPKPDKR